MVKKMQKNRAEEIKTKPKEKCIVCGSKGEIFYKKINDNLFGVPGVWNTMKCSNPECGLLWLNPFPLETEIKKMYKTYYTHDLVKLKERKKSFLGSILHYIYVITNFSLGITKENKKIFQYYFNNGNKRKLLEIGCGNGDRLERLIELGWDVEGQEVDPVSAKIAKKRLNVKIHLGDLCKLSLNRENYDGIVINHVIEHAFDPISLLKECHKLLRQGGQLILNTPNIKSLGHKYFKEAWIGLDPPRHLYLFNSSVLSKIAKQTGFNNIESKTSFANADGLLLWSYEIQNKLINKKKKILPDNLKSFLLQILERLLIIFNRQIGEQCVLIARK